MGHGASFLVYTPFGGTMISAIDSTISSNKLEMAVQKAKDIVGLQAQLDLTRDTALRKQVITKTDRLLGFLMTQFKPNPMGAAALDAAIDMGVTVMNAGSMDRLPDAAIPIAIMRDLFANHRIRVDGRAMTNWTKFTEMFDVL